MKKATSFRIEEEQIKQLDQLVDFYVDQMKLATEGFFDVSLSKAHVVELLIKEKYKQLKEQGKLKS